MMKTLQKYSLLAVSSLLFVACSSTPIAPTPAPAPAPAKDMPAPVKPAAVQPTVVPKPALPPYLDPNNPLSTEKSVYFAYDDYTIKTDYTTMLTRHAKFLAANPQISIKVEGNADERGGTEYNLALGQKRAQAVLKVLKAQGVKDTQLEAISWGKEKPKANGHDEASWAQNRRVDLNYPQK